MEDLQQTHVTHRLWFAHVWLTMFLHIYLSLWKDRSLLLLLFIEEAPFMYCFMLQTILDF